MQFPPELLNQIGIVLEIVVAVLTALTVAFWIGLVIWTFRDIRSRPRDFFAWLLAILLVLILGPIGLALYFLLRPKETLAEVYDRQLEEEALLRDITARRACPSCQTVTEPEWLICPRCRAELRGEEHQHQQAKHEGGERCTDNTKNTRGLVNESILVDSRLNAQPDSHQHHRGHRPDS